MSVREKVSIWQVEEGKLEDDGWVEPLAHAFCYLFNEESEMEGDAYQPEEEAKAIREQLMGEQARLWVATVPYDRERHLEGKGYLPVELEDGPQAVIGFLWVMGEMSKEKLGEEIAGSMGLFGQKVDDYQRLVKGKLEEWGEERVRETAYVPEFGVRKDYRGKEEGVSSKLMWELAKFLHFERKSKHFAFWTSRRSKMHEIMERFLKGEDWMEFSDERETILMKGKVGIATLMLALDNWQYQLGLWKEKWLKQ